MKRVHLPISTAVPEATVPSDRTASAETVDWLLAQLDYIINKTERFE